jgi:hypothetical protein
MDTSSVQYTLRPKDIEKAAELFGYDQAIFKQFNDQRLLNTVYIRSLLIRMDFERMTSGLHWLEHTEKDYSYPEIMRALAKNYGVTVKVIQQTLHGHSGSIYFCSKCGIRVPRETYKRTGGLCSQCFADTIDI